MENHIVSWSYCLEDRSLLVRFQGGTVYTYKPVNEDSWNKMKTAKDTAKEIQNLVRNGTTVGVEK
jgi:predicted transcriptional regulator